MKSSFVAAGSVAALAVVGFGAPAMAAEAPPAQVPVVTAHHHHHHHHQVWRGSGRSPVTKHAIAQYNLHNRDLLDIQKAKRWAHGSHPTHVRVCESGNNYRISTGNGYYGAYQFSHSTWLGVGGGKYASYPHKAPRFAQDQMAYHLYKRSGWGPWTCG